MTIASQAALTGELEAAAASHTPSVPAARVVFGLAPDGMQRPLLAYSEASGTGPQQRAFGGSSTESDRYLLKPIADSATEAIAFRDTITEWLDRAAPAGTLQITVENPIPVIQLPNQSAYMAGVYVRVKHTRGG